MLKHFTAALAAQVRAEAGARRCVHEALPSPQVKASVAARASFQMQGANARKLPPV